MLCALRSLDSVMFENKNTVPRPRRQISIVLHSKYLLWYPHMIEPEIYTASELIELLYSKDVVMVEIVKSDPP